jgi:Mor family transcriptional regulator
VPARKLNRINLRTIARLYRGGESVRQIAKRFPVSHTTIYRALRLDTYRDIKREPVPCRDRIEATVATNRKLTDADIAEIRRLFWGPEDQNPKQLARRFGVTPNWICYIIRGRVRQPAEEGEVACDSSAN